MPAPLPSTVKVDSAPCATDYRFNILRTKFEGILNQVMKQQHQLHLISKYARQRLHLDHCLPFLNQRLQTLYNMSKDLIAVACWMCLKGAFKSCETM